MGIDRREIVQDPLLPELVTARAQASILKEANAMYSESSNPIKRVLGPRSYKPLLQKRIAVEKAWAAFVRSTPEADADWSQGSASYQGTSLTTNEYMHRSDEYDPAKLQGDELILDRNVNELLARREETKKPVVMMDFGGGQGLSMIRLAAHHKAEIEDGRLVIMVTNLAHKPNAKEKPDEEGYTGVAHSIRARMRKEGDVEMRDDVRKMLDFIQTNQGLVTFLVGTAPELPKQIGDRKIDILHEAYALKHVHAPDVALAVFGGLLSEEGTLYMQPNIQGSSSDPVTLPNGETVNPRSNVYTNSRKTALHVGMRLLRREHQMAEVFSNDTYAVFKKASAPQFTSF